MARSITSSGSPARRATWIAATLLVAAVIVIIGNTIRLDIQNRRAEIEVSKLLGASDGFVRRPFLYTGFWYGLLGGRRNQFHQDIHAIISDLSIMIRPTLTIVDGSRVLMENGPTGGDPSNVKDHDAVLAGVDPVAIDAWAFEHLLERGRNYPEYLERAQDKGAGRIDWHGRVREIV